MEYEFPDKYINIDFVVKIKNTKGNGHNDKIINNRSLGRISHPHTESNIFATIRRMNQDDEKMSEGSSAMGWFGDKYKWHMIALGYNMYMFRIESV